jgi:dihydroflavonol-4-reductase
VALHCVRQLLERGYRVRCTLRDARKEPAVRSALAPQVDATNRLSFFEADLTADAGWREAIQGATYVLHTASPVPAREPEDEGEVVVPAREGTLRVLRAASEARVARVVLTSSAAAIVAGRLDSSRVFTESDWADVSQPIPAYDKSKTLAERAAWDLVASLPSDRRFELVALNPVFVLGPSLAGGDPASNEIVAKLIRRQVPGAPRLHVALVDVRDVASAHLLAMTTPAAAGERFLLVSDMAWMQQMAQVLADAGYRVPTRAIPDWLFRIASWFDPTLRLVTRYLGLTIRLSSEKAEQVLGWRGRPMKPMVLDTAASSVARRGAPSLMASSSAIASPARQPRAGRPMPR